MCIRDSTVASCRGADIGFSLIGLEVDDLSELQTHHVMVEGCAKLSVVYSRTVIDIFQNPPQVGKMCIRDRVN